MSNIHINYNTLAKHDQPQAAVSDELIKRAKRWLGYGARKELVQQFDHQLRVLAVEVAQRQVDPHALYEAGKAGLFEALKMYEVGQTPPRFPDFAVAFIRASMIHARDKNQTLPRNDR